MDCLYGFVWTPGFHFSINSQIHQLASCWSIALGYHEIFINSTLGFSPAHSGSFYSLLHTDVVYKHTCILLERTLEISKDLPHDMIVNIYCRVSYLHESTRITNRVIRNRIPAKCHQSWCVNGEVGGAEINPSSSLWHLHPTGLQIADKSIFHWRRLNFSPQRRFKETDPGEIMSRKMTHLTSILKMRYLIYHSASQKYTVGDPACKGAIHLSTADRNCYHFLPPRLIIYNFVLSAELVSHWQICHFEMQLLK